jgi:hypothetical protein
MAKTEKELKIDALKGITHNIKVLQQRRRQIKKELEALEGD